MTHTLTTDPVKTFQRFMDVSDTLPLFDLSLPFALAWEYSNKLLNEFNKSKTIAALQALLPNVRYENLKSLNLENSKILLDGEWLCRKLELGKNVTIKNRAKLIAHGKIILGDSSSLGQGTLLVTVSHPIYPTQRHLIKIDSIKISPFALVGAKATLLCTGKGKALEVGQHSIVLPGSVITKDVEEYTVMRGLNKVLLSGKEHFWDAPQSSKLKDRLKPNALKRILESNPQLTEESDISVDTTTHEQTYNFRYSEKLSNSTFRRRDFFNNSTEAAIDSSFLVPPLYFHGHIPKIYPKSILNSNTSFISPKINSIHLSSSNLLAPNTLLKAGGDKKIKLEESVWIGANSKIITNDEDITIGSGSIIAAGSIINNSVAPMTIVGNQGTVIRKITEADKCDLPTEWSDVKKCVQNRQEALATKEYMSLQEQENKALELLNL
ncbi:MAG: hypothetical protein MK132_20155 [Lentisphaerales bacterium]|nr:hypothetical protein [Lentisphaerales bacterium]